MFSDDPHMDVLQESSLLDLVTYVLSLTGVFVLFFKDNFIYIHVFQSSN